MRPVQDVLRKVVIILLLLWC